MLLILYVKCFKNKKGGYLINYERLLGGVLFMAKLKGKGVVLAGLVAGAASILSKKENRDKAMDFINGAKTKATKAIEDQKQNFQGNSNNTDVDNNYAKSDVAADVAETAANPLQVDENKFISEGGAQKTINDYNHQQQ